MLLHVLGVTFGLDIGPNQNWFLKLGELSLVGTVEIWQKSDATSFLLKIFEPIHVV